MRLFHYKGYAVNIKQLNRERRNHAGWRRILSRYLAWLPPIERIDIGSDAVLVEQFSTCVPVLVLDGKVRFRGRVSEDLLRRLIEGTPPIY